MLLQLLQRQPGESCGEIWGEGGILGVREGAGGLWGGFWGPGKGWGGFGSHLHAAQLLILPAK